MTEKHNESTIISEEELITKVQDILEEKPKNNHTAKAVITLGSLLLGGAILNSLLSSPSKRFSSQTIATAREIGEAIRLRRKDLGLTQQDLAEKSGTRERFISEVERGKETAEVGKILDLLDALGLEAKISIRS